MDILKDKQYKSYDRLSRYSNFPFYFNTVDNKYMCGTTLHLSANTPYASYTVLRGDTLDSLSLKFYKNPTYYWIIADYNRIQDPFTHLVPGTVIKIPVFSSIRFEEV